MDNIFGHFMGYKPSAIISIEYINEIDNDTN